MTVKPTQWMLLAFGGIVVYLMVSSAKRTAQGATTQTLPSGASGGGASPNGVQPVTYNQPSTSLSPSQQQEKAQDLSYVAPSSSGTANDFFQALGSDTGLPGGGQ